MPKIFFDLDGTILNVKKRLHKLFCELTEKTIDYDEYWNLKAMGYTQAMMLDYISYPQDKKNFSSAWLKNVERIDLLKLDYIRDGVKEALDEFLSLNYDMYIVTNRQLADNLTKQLSWLDLDKYFTKVIMTYQIFSKAMAVRNSGIMPIDGYFVGDSWEDMNTACELGIRGIFLGGCWEAHADGSEKINCVADFEMVRGVIQNEE